MEEAKEEVEEIVEFLKDPKNLVGLEEKFQEELYWLVPQALERLF